MTAGKYLYDIHSHLTKIILQYFTEKLYIPNCAPLSPPIHTHKDMHMFILAS